MQKKKKWITPQLIVLVRGKPEEAILGVCKSYSAWGGFPDVTVKQCNESWCSRGCESSVGS